MNLTGVRISSYYFKKITFLPTTLVYSLSDKESYRPANTEDYRLPCCFQKYINNLKSLLQLECVGISQAVRGIVLIKMLQAGSINFRSVLPPKKTLHVTINSQ